MDYFRLRAIRALGACSAASLLAWSTPALADDWTAGVTDTGTESFALTINQDGAVFGQWCSTSTADCYWAAASTIKCEEGARYPILINAQPEATHAELVCNKSFRLQGKTYWSYLFTEFKPIDNVARTARIFGIAMPLASGRFEVLRFDATGAVDALAKSHRAARETTSTSTRSQSL